MAGRFGRTDRIARGFIPVSRKQLRQLNSAEDCVYADAGI